MSERWSGTLKSGAENSPRTVRKHVRLTVCGGRWPGSCPRRRRWPGRAHDPVRGPRPNAQEAQTGAQLRAWWTFTASVGSSATPASSSPETGAQRVSSGSRRESWATSAETERRKPKSGPSWPPRGLAAARRCLCPSRPLQARKRAHSASRSPAAVETTPQPGPEPRREHHPVAASNPPHRRRVGVAFRARACMRTLARACRHAHTRARAQKRTSQPPFAPPPSPLRGGGGRYSEGGLDDVSVSSTST